MGRFICRPGYQPRPMMMNYNRTYVVNQQSHCHHSGGNGFWGGFLGGFLGGGMTNLFGGLFGGNMFGGGMGMGGGYMPGMGGIMPGMDYGSFNRYNNGFTNGNGDELAPLKTLYGSKYNFEKVGNKYYAVDEKGAQITDNSAQGLLDKLNTAKAEGETAATPTTVTENKFTPEEANELIEASEFKDIITVGEDGKLHCTINGEEKTRDLTPAGLGELQSMYNQAKATQEVTNTRVAAAAEAGASATTTQTSTSAESNSPRKPITDGTIKLKDHESLDRSMETDNTVDKINEEQIKNARNTEELANTLINIATNGQKVSPEARAAVLQHLKSINNNTDYSKFVLSSEGRNNYNIPNNDTINNIIKTHTKTNEEISEKSNNEPAKVDYNDVDSVQTALINKGYKNAVITKNFIGNYICRYTDENGENKRFNIGPDLNKASEHIEK